MGRQRGDPRQPGCCQCRVEDLTRVVDHGRRLHREANEGEGLEELGLDRRARPSDA